MNLGNSTLWGEVLPGGLAGEAADGSLDTTQVIDEILPSLHASSRADLVFWTGTQLIQWMDEAVKRLSRAACVFVGRSTSILSVASQASYSLPARHISTLHVSYLATPLRPAGTIELESLNPAYQTDTGTPLRWYEDLQGDTSFGVAPVPDTSDEAMPVIYEGFPPELDASQNNTLIAAPPVLKGYLAMAVLASAYGVEGDMEAPDIAAHCRERLAMYDEIWSSYYGAGI